jgi:hypothetical protein
MNIDDVDVPRLSDVVEAFLNDASASGKETR